MTAAQVLAFEDGQSKRRPAAARFRDVDFPSWRAAAVMFALLQFVDREGWCWPSVRTLTERTKLSRSTVQRGLRELESVDLVRTAPPLTKDGSARYLIPIAAAVEGEHGGVSVRHGGVCETRGGCLTDTGGVSVRHPKEYMEGFQKKAMLASLAGEPNERAADPAVSAQSPATVPDRATDGQRALLAIVSRELGAPLTDWAERDALTTAEAHGILKHAARFRGVDHDHEPDQAAMCGFVRCKCGAVHAAGPDPDHGFCLEVGSWWLGCPPTVDPGADDEPIAGDPNATDDPDDDDCPAVIEWGPLPEPLPLSPHYCVKCGVGAPRWIGRCAHCKAWNTLKPGKAPAVPAAGVVAPQDGAGEHPIAAPPLTADGRTADVEAWRAARAQETAEAVDATRGLRWGPPKGMGDQ